LTQQRATFYQQMEVQEMKRMKFGIAALIITVLGTVVASVTAQSPFSSNNLKATDVTVTITGGFETDSRDHGRPVVLIASMLGVTPDVFREAFSGITPAKNGGPTREEAQANKKALLKVLAPYGITNEKLDEVSNYYRYKGSLGQTWPHTQATATAVVVDGKITAITIINAGAGYTSIPKVLIKQGNLTYQATATVSYTTDFKTNGSITSITLNS
jgi:hypothetical protein